MNSQTRRRAVERTVVERISALVDEHAVLYILANVKLDQLPKVIAKSD